MINAFIHRIFKGDRVVWTVMALLCTVSVIEVFSALGADSFAAGSHFKSIISHAGILFIGVLITVVLHNFSYKYTLLLMYPMIIGSIVMLILALTSGDTVNEASRWYGRDVFGFTIQPSEIAKATLVLFTAWKLGWGKRTPESLERAFWEILILTGIFVGLTVKDNLSTALIMCVFSYIMLIIGGAPRKNMIWLTVIALVAAVTFLILLKNIPEVSWLDRWSLWRKRLLAESVDVKSPDYRITDHNYQQHYAKIAIARGIGLGVFPGNSTQRDFLPEAFNDFIYAIIIEDMGWFGAILVPLLYIILLIRCAKLSLKCSGPVPMLLMMGSTIIIAFQAFLNMGVAVGILPVTGQTLPLVSKGGSSQLMTCFLFAIILSVSHFGMSEDDRSVLQAEQTEDEQREAAARKAAEELAEIKATQQNIETEDYASMAE